VLTSIASYFILREVFLDSILHQYHPLGFQGSRIAQGYWRANEWGMNKQANLSFIEACLALGVTTFDHADIYGDYQCESLFGDSLALKPSLRDTMQLISKCGIKLKSNARPEHSMYQYDVSFDHIIASVENSLRQLKTDYLDLILLHRATPLMDPDEVARAFEHLMIQGKVKHFGVSNFSAAQFDLLQSRMEVPLVVNQSECSVLQAQAFESGEIDHLHQHAVTPMAWSPLAGGRLFNGSDDQAIRMRELLHGLSDKYEGATLDQLALAWLLKHPAKICPVMGSGKIARLELAVAACHITLNDDDWYRIWCVSMGKALD